MRREEPAPVPVAAPIRWWRLRPWSRNHLMRASDRFEAIIVVLAAAVVLLLIPIAATFGAATHTRLEHQTQALRAAVHEVPAVLLEDTYLAPDSPEYAIRPVGTQNTARARWTTPGGERTGAAQLVENLIDGGGRETDIVALRRPETITNEGAHGEFTLEVGCSPVAHDSNPARASRHRNGATLGDVETAASLQHARRQASLKGTCNGASQSPHRPRK